MAHIETKKEQVYVLFWHGWEDRGILSISKDRATAMNDWRKYSNNPRLISEFIGNDNIERAVANDPDDAIEVWDVQ